MDNPWDEITKALQAAREVNRAAAKHADSMVAILTDDPATLRKVSSYYLKRLKKNLENFNMHTERWK